MINNIKKVGVKLKNFVEFITNEGVLYPSNEGIKSMELDINSGRIKLYYDRVYNVPFVKCTKFEDWIRFYA